MSNVIPSAARHALVRDAKARLVFVGALLVGLAAVVSIAALIPALLLTVVPLIGEHGEMSDSEKEQAALYEESRTQAAQTRAHLAVLLPFTEERVSPQSLISRVYSLRPSGVSISAIKYYAGTSGQIVITGTSEAREPLNDFRTTLTDTGLFESVSVPVAALVGALEGNFSMTLSGKF